MLLDAYRLGIFPMADSRKDGEIHWYDPQRRGILPIGRMHVPARLRKTLRKHPYSVTFDRDFEQVIRACAAARADTWISEDIIRLYTGVHKKGKAHSVEAWAKDGTLAGGLYGISLGGAFFGESMFSAQKDASKIALVHLAARLWRRGFSLLDAQFVNSHLAQFGCIEISRNEYQDRLKKALAQETCFYKDQSPVSTGSAAGFAASSEVFSSPCFAGDFLSSSGDCTGSDSDEKLSCFSDVDLFLQEITQTS